MILHYCGTDAFVSGYLLQNGRFAAGAGRLVPAVGASRERSATAAVAVVRTGSGCAVGTRAGRGSAGRTRAGHGLAPLPRASRLPTPRPRALCCAHGREQRRRRRRRLRPRRRMLSQFRSSVLLQWHCCHANLLAQETGMVCTRSKSVVAATVQRIETCPVLP